MASKISILRDETSKRGDYIGSLLPANWIEMEGKFSPEELIIIANAIKHNFNKANGNKK